jgi:RNA polymerase sigma factor FliA
MRFLEKGSWAPPQTNELASEAHFTELHSTDSVGRRPPSNLSATSFPSGAPDLLTAEQERFMVEQLPIVRFIARRIHERLPQHFAIDDLYSAGVVGLLDAISKFDPSKQVKFRSYAQFRIRGAILDSLRTLDWSPRELRRKGRAIEEAIQTLTGQLSRSPTDIEIAQKLRISLTDYQHSLGELNGLWIGTLYSEPSTDSDEEELIHVKGRPEDDPLFRYLDGEMRQRLIIAISDLPERERLVMTLYYYEETTMKEIGLILGVLQSRVSQIHASAVLHLRARLAMSTSPKKPQNKPGGGSFDHT